MVIPRGGEPRFPTATDDDRALMGERFDPVVPGSVPAGQQAAVQAAALGASAAIYLTRLSEGGLYGQRYRVNDRGRPSVHASPRLSARIRS
jgi:hypothetical protein